MRSSHRSRPERWPRRNLPRCATRVRGHATLPPPSTRAVTAAKRLGVPHGPGANASPGTVTAKANWRWLQSSQREGTDCGSVFQTGITPWSRTRAGEIEPTRYLKYIYSHHKRKSLSNYRFSIFAEAGRPSVRRAPHVRAPAACPSRRPRSPALPTRGRMQHAAACGRLQHAPACLPGHPRSPRAGACSMPQHASQRLAEELRCSSTFTTRGHAAVMRMRKTSLKQSAFLQIAVD